MMLSGSAKLLELLENPIQATVPKGWMTVQQISKKSGLSVPQVGKHIREGVSEGKIERRVYKIQIGDGMRAVPHYFIKK